MPPPCLRPHAVRLGALLALFLGLALPGSAQVVSPDPELFDGTHTKKDEPDAQPETAIDDWELANLILYDSDEEGSEKGGQGRAGGKNPGMDIGIAGGLPIPLPLGEGTGAGGLPGLPNPLAQGAGPAPPSLPTPPAGMTPLSPEVAGKPGDMAIGDPSQTIKTAGQPTTAAADRSVPPPAIDLGNTQNTGTGGDEVPNAASTQQSRSRGAGVEKGDAMPSDL